MSRPALGIRRKIVIPFTLLFAGAALIVALVSFSLISRTLDASLADRCARATEMISRGGYAQSPGVLENLKRVVGADIVTYHRRGDVLASTLDPVHDAGFLPLVLAPDVPYAIFARGETLVMRDVVWRNEPYRIAHRPLRHPSGAIVAMVIPTSDLAATKARLARSIALISVLTVVLVSLLGQWIASTITSPLSRLAEHTRQMEAGELAPVTGIESRDEVGSLVRALNEMVKRVRDAEQERLHAEKLSVTGQLAARVAHDIRNPLSSIKMQAQMLRNKLQPGPGNRESLAAILKEIDRVEWVVGGLLDLSRPARLQLRRGSLNDVAEEVLRTCEAGLRHRGIEIEEHLEPDLPDTVLDPDRLHDALRNLVANAADAMPEGGVLRVATGKSAEGNEVWVEVVDQGAGMEPEALDRAFDPFFTTKPDGVGLGLLNSRSVAERHGGRAELGPAPDGGTRAALVIPVVDGEAPIAAPAAHG